MDDMVVTLADCLQDYLRTGINDEVLREQNPPLQRELRGPFGTLRRRRFSWPPC